MRALFYITCLDFVYSSLFMLFYFYFYLGLQQNNAIVTSQCMHFFCQGRELQLTDGSALSVTKFNLTSLGLHPSTLQNFGVFKCSGVIKYIFCCLLIY